MRRRADMRQREDKRLALGEGVAEGRLEIGEAVAFRLLGVARRRQWIGLNSRFQRTVHGHSQIFQAASPCLTEKKRSSARPIRFS